jgi:hypothetical protein
MPVPPENTPIVAKRLEKPLSAPAVRIRQFAPMVLELLSARIKAETRNLISESFGGHVPAAAKFRISAC